MANTTYIPKYHTQISNSILGVIHALGCVWCDTLTQVFNCTTDKLTSVKDLSNEKQSKLELYVEVLKALGETQSLNIKAIQGRTNIDKPILSVAMKFLEQQNLVQLRNVGNNVEYQNTNRGVRVFKFLAQGTRSSENEVHSGVNLFPVQRSFE
jgi:predicted transcriptional regulator